MKELAYKSSLIREKGVVLKVISTHGDGAIFLWDTKLDIPDVVQIPYNILPAPPRVGETWNIDGYIVDTDWGDQMLAVDCARQLPDGETFSIYVAKNERYVGIDRGRAENLWSTYRNEIFGLLESNNVDQIVADTKIPRKVISNLCEQWVEYKHETEVVRWLHNQRLPTRLALKIVDYYGEVAIQHLSEDPYRLLAFLKWKEVDAAAKTLGVADNDPRRLVAAVVSTMYENWSKGHTAITVDRLREKLRSKNKLGLSCKSDEVIKLSVARNELIRLENNLYQHAGAYALEQVVMDFVTSRNYQQNMLNNFDPKRLRAFEDRKSKEIGHSFTLNEEQIKAIEVMLSTSFACITGGAGVGKTTILEAVFHQLGNPEMVIQCALTGRAQQRMTEATGWPAMTIARLINIGAQGGVQDGSIIIIDEASMLDVPLFVKLMRSLPHDVSMFLIGDSYQLPPIGPGLIFHLAVQSGNIRVVELKKVHRAAANTGLPQASLAIRNQQMPELDEFQGLNVKDHGLSLLRTEGDTAQQKGILRCYRELSEQGEVQVLTYSNRLCDIINMTLHNEYCEVIKMNGDTPIVIGPAHGRIAEGEPIIWVDRNDYDREIFNGSMGTLVEIYGAPSTEIDKDGHEVILVAQAKFDSCGSVGLSEDDFRYVKLAYAITVHKAQGSQWDRVIVAIESGRNIDNSWLYTAITRTKKQAICVGSESVFRELACSTPKAFQRIVGMTL
ncbi:MAG: AAA family ATPase [Sedimenticola sp.]